MIHSRPHRVPLRIATSVTLGSLLVLGGAAIAVAAPVPASGPATGGTAVALTVPGFSSAAAGESASFAIDQSGGLWSWGLNPSGQLGDGTTIDRSVPELVAGLAGVEIAAVSTAWAHSIAVDTDGQVWAWGDNSNGQLGNGSTTAELSPVAITGFGGRTITQVAASVYHSAAVATDGTLWTWGQNLNGVLGDGTTTTRTAPVQVTALSGLTILSVQAGLTHTVALASDGTLWAWGLNAQGQFGNGTTVPSTTPVQVSGLSSETIVELASGSSSHSLARGNDGTVWAWGSNSVGQLGDGTTTDRIAPVAIAAFGTGAVSELSVSPYYSMALTSSGQVWSWGANTAGQLGDGSTVNRTTPGLVSGLSGRTITQLSAGFYEYALAVDSDGAVWGWGYNADGQFADGTTTNQLLPVRALPVTATVSFDGLLASTPVVVDETTITVTAPSHAAGTVDVAISTTFDIGGPGPTVTLADAYTYLSPATNGAPTITSAPPHAGTVGLNYRHQLTAAGEAPITFAVTQGSLPAGIVVNSGTGEITGRPTATGLAAFTIVASNPAGSTELHYTILVRATSGALAAGDPQSSTTISYARLAPDPYSFRTAVGVALMIAGLATALWAPMTSLLGRVRP